MPHPCPLCAAAQSSFYLKDKEREYFQCGNCGLVFVPSKYFLPEAGEKKRYDLHQNSPEDKNYRQFLSRLFLPVRERLAPGSRGLDFGCGPGPTLSVMFEEAGFAMKVYDIFYAPDERVLKEEYDFITATEVLEHLREPGKELERLWACLRPGGRLGIMTQTVISKERFAAWHYKNDPTHICFYSEVVFRFLAAKWNAGLDFAGKDVILFHKNS